MFLQNNTEISVQKNRVRVININQSPSLGAYNSQTKPMSPAFSQTDLFLDWIFRKYGTPSGAPFSRANLFLDLSFGSNVSLRSKENFNRTKERSRKRNMGQLYAPCDGLPVLTYQALKSTNAQNSLPVFRTKKALTFFEQFLWGNTAINYNDCDNPTLLKQNSTRILSPPVTCCR